MQRPCTISSLPSFAAASYCCGVSLFSRNMPSILGSRHTIQSSSPLEGSDSFRAQQADSSLRKLARREWWLWFSAFFVATLSAVAFVLTSFPSLFRQHEHFYEIRSDQARWGILSLLLLFNGWMLYRQWFFRRERKHFSGNAGSADDAALPDKISTSSSGVRTIDRKSTRLNSSHLVISYAV